MRFDIPVDPSSPQAQEWIREELAKPEYQAAKPTWFDIAAKAVQDWIESLLQGPTGDAGPVLLLVVVLVIAALIVCLFAANIGTILDHPVPFAWVLPVVFLFFVSTYLVGEGLGRLLRLRYPELVLLTMTTSARNAPLMLAITSVALPGQPLVFAAIVLGMLIEFPHLTALTHLLRRREAARPVTVPSEALLSQR